MKNDEFYIRHMLEAIKLIEEATESITYEEFSENPEKQAAVIRWLEIIGEASKKVSNELRNTHPEIPWRDIASTRDRLIHGYFSVDIKIVWEIMRKDLPELKEKLRRIVDEKK